MLHISLLVLTRLNKTDFAIFITLMWSLLPKDLTTLNLSIKLRLLFSVSFMRSLFQGDSSSELISFSLQMMLSGV